MRIKENERDASGSGQATHLSYVCLIALLIQDKKCAVLSKRARGDEPPRGRGLAGSRCSEHHDVLPRSERQTGAPSAFSGHRHEPQ